MLARTPGEQIPGIGLEEDVVDTCEPYLRIAARGALHRQALDPEANGGKRVAGRTDERGASRGSEHPQGADLPQQSSVPASVLFLPELQRTGGHPRVDHVRPV